MVWCMTQRKTCAVFSQDARNTDCKEDFVKNKYKLSLDVSAPRIDWLIDRSFDWNMPPIACLKPKTYMNAVTV